jgi:phytanoyl-CoA hydroxylase
MKNIYKQQFEENGFIILKKVFNEKKLEEIRELHSEIVRSSEKNFQDPFKPWSLEHRLDNGVLYDLYQRHPEFQDMAKNNQILDSLTEILGENIYLYSNSLIYKPKNKKNGVPWHQDFMARVDEPLKMIAWIAIDKVTKENGTVKVIPGSHKKGHLPYYIIPGETHHTRVNEEYIEQDKVIYVELDPGDVLIFNMLLLHASDEVHTEIPRRVYRCAYQSMQDNIYTPRQSPIVLKGGRPDFLEKNYSIPKKVFSKTMNKNCINNENNNLHFSKKFNSFFGTIEILRSTKDKYLLYGNGTIGKTIKALIPEKIITTIDKNNNYISNKFDQDSVYSIENISSIHYDKIIISVLGREHNIIKELSEKYNVPKEKIITFEL